MDVHFISTLTPDDEDRFAPVVIDALKAILDVMPISYTVRIETANAKVFQHSNAGPLRGDTVRGDTVRGDTVRGDTVRGDRSGDAANGRTTAGHPRRAGV